MGDAWLRLRASGARDWPPSNGSHYVAHTINKSARGKPNSPHPGRLTPFEGVLSLGVIVTTSRGDCVAPITNKTIAVGPCAPLVLSREHLVRKFEMTRAKNSALGATSGFPRTTTSPAEPRGGTDSHPSVLPVDTASSSKGTIILLRRRCRTDSLSQTDALFVTLGIRLVGGGT